MPVKSLVQAAIWLMALLPALRPPGLLEHFAAAVESAVRSFASRRWLVCAAMALTVLLARAALLPFWDVPQPVVLDEYGYLLQADTFASGRLTNPPHPLNEFFTIPYILQTPTYNAKFPPGQGLFLALGQAAFSHPWFGVWLSCGLLAAALCWALQGWFPPQWALFGSILTLPLCTLTYFMNSYWGGAVAAIGGALLLGALPRLRTGRASVSVVFALGAALLAATRPFEGLLVALPLTIALLLQKLSLRQWLALSLTGAAALAAICGYNAAVTGHPLRLPYLEYEAQYPMASHFTFLHPPPEKSFSLAGLIIMDHWERAAWNYTRQSGFFFRRFLELQSRLSILLGSALVLLPALAFFSLWWRRRELRPVACAVALTAISAFVETVYFAHYAAPALAATLVLVVEGFRQVRQWRPPSGVWLSRTVPVAVVLIAAMAPATKIARDQSMNHTGAGGRELLEQILAPEPGQHVVLVRHQYPSPVEPRWQDYNSTDLLPTYVEFVANTANIDSQRIIWAHDLGPETNRRILQHYKERKFWLFDLHGAELALQRYPTE